VYYQKSAGLLAALAATALLCSGAGAQDKASALLENPDASERKPRPKTRAGQKLFEKEWQWNDAIESLDEKETLSALFQRRRTVDARTMRDSSRPTLPDQFIGGDGLGPMHNATSCAACHIDGGGSGVDRNVTLITIDPRSDLASFDAATATQTVMDFYPNLLAASG
tara:strand:- start:20861 stop:21361 length:501 start_codon:yes stop_codon:yes gene_type:complete